MSPVNVAVGNAAEHLIDIVLQTTQRPQDQDPIGFQILGSSLIFPWTTESCSLVYLLPRLLVLSVVLYTIYDIM